MKTVQKAKSAIAITLTGVVLISASAIKLNKNRKYEDSEIITSISLEQETTNNAVNILETTNYVNNETTDNKTEYSTKNVTSNIQTTHKDKDSVTTTTTNPRDNVQSTSRIELDGIYSKGFNKESIELIENSINKLNDNYEKMRQIYSNCDLPEKEEFVNDFINVIINDINKIVIVDPNVRSYYSYKLNGYRGMSYVDNGLLLINGDLSKENKEENFIHEVMHFDQSRIINNRNNIKSGLYNVLTEGESSWFSAVTNSLNFSSAISNVYNDEMMCCMKGLGGGDYPKFSRTYNMLVSMIGYSTIEECKNNYSEDLIINAINEKYDIDARAFVNSINSICMSDSVSVKEIIDVENVYLKCLSQDLSAIDNKDDLLRFLNQYRAYRLQFSIKCIENENGFMSSF